MYNFIIDNKIPWESYLFSILWFLSCRFLSDPLQWSPPPTAVTLVKASSGLCFAMSSEQFSASSYWTYRQHVTVSLKWLLHLTSKTPAVLEFLSGDSSSVSFAKSSLPVSFSELECSRVQSLNLFSIYRPSLVISSSFMALNVILICLLWESSLSLQICSPSFFILASALGGVLYVIYQQTSLCLLVGCEQWWTEAGY